MQFACGSRSTNRTLLPRSAEGGGEVEGGGGFTHAALLVGDGDDFHSGQGPNPTAIHSQETATLAIKTAKGKINTAFFQALLSS